MKWERGRGQLSLGKCDNNEGGWAGRLGAEKEVAFE